MSPLFEIRLVGIPELERVLKINFGALVREMLLEVAKLVKREVSHPPGPVKKPIRWASERQRRYVMALVRKHGPWVRETHALSQQLLGSWQITAETDYRVRVHNPASYGPWVQAADDQQPFHRDTGWRTDEAARDLVVTSGEVERIVEKIVDAAFRGR